MKINRLMSSNCFLFHIALILITTQIFFCNNRTIEYVSDEERIYRCNNLNPKSKYECNFYTTENNYCCFLYLSNEVSELYNNTLKNNFCLSLEKSRYNKLGNLNYMNINYRIDCGVGTQIFSSSQSLQAGANCGVNKPEKPSDCFINSKIDYHCCFYKIKNNTGCYNLGAKYSGIYKDDDKLYYYECASNYIRILGYKKLVIFIFFLAILL